jgi:hypothetical protein
MTATAPRTDVPAVPPPRAPSEPLPRPRRERPRDQYWDVFEGRWRTVRR